MTALVITIVILSWIASAVVRTASDKRTRKQFRENNTRWEQQYAWNAKQETINEKTAAKLRKHDEEIRKLKQAMLVAEVDIKSANERMSYLYSLLDIAEKQQRDAHPGSKSDEKAQRKIMALRNQIATAKKNQIKSKSKYNELKFKMSELEEVA